MTPEDLAVLVAPYEAQIRGLVAERFNLLAQISQLQAATEDSPTANPEAGSA